MRKFLYLYVLCFITIISCNNDDKRIAVTGVSLNKTELTLTGIGTTETLEAFVVPANAATNFEWFSDKPDIAAVDTDGKVTALAKGTAIITVKTTNSEKMANCTVTVEEAKIAVTGVSLNKLELVIANIGVTKTLEVIVEPSDASDAALEWSSDKPAVASVNAGGEITAVGEGTAVITVKTADGGKTATCMVTIVGCRMCETLDPCVVDPQNQWKHPLKPGWWEYPEWDFSKTQEDNYAALQIPEEILFSLSSEELTDIVLRHRGISVVASSSVIHFNNYYDSFNGIRELFKREDAAKELLKHYNCMMQDIYVFCRMEHEQSGAFMFNLQILESLLGLFAYKSDVLSNEDCKRMLRCLVCAHEKQIGCNEPFRENIFAMAHVIVKLDAQYTEIIPKYVFSGAHTQESYNIITELSYQLIK